MCSNLGEPGCEKAGPRLERAAGVDVTPARTLLMMKAAQDVGELDVDIDPIARLEVETVNTNPPNMFEEQERIRDQTSGTVLEIDARNRAGGLGSKVLEGAGFGFEGVGTGSLDRPR